MKDQYKAWVEQEAEEYNEINDANVRIERHGGWIYLMCNDLILHQSHGYYDMNRYMVENFRKIKEQIGELANEQ